MASLGLRLIGYFLLKMIPLLIQGIVQKCIVKQFPSEYIDLDFIQ